MIEVLTASFAQIVGLISNYASEKRNSETQSYQEFLLWLDKKHHNSIKQEIQDNHVLSMQIKAIINTSNRELLDKLGKIENLLVGICAHVTDFSSLALAVSPNKSISAQALSILKQIVENDSEGVILSGTILTGTDKTYDVVLSELKFLDDDLDVLCCHDLLKQSLNSKGSKKYSITRLATNLVKVNS